MQCAYQGAGHFETMMNFPRRLRILFSGLTLALAAGATMAAPAAGDRAPDRLGKLPTGETVKLANYAGRVLVIAFWQAECPSCMKQLPMLESLQKVARNRVQVIAINVGTRSEFKDAVREMGKVKMMVTHDTAERGALAYGVTTLPHLAVIGRDGKIVEVHRGYTEAALAEIINDVNVAVSASAPVASNN